MSQDVGEGVGGVEAIAGGFDFAEFLPDYTDGEGSVRSFGVEGDNGLSFGEPFPASAVWPGAGGAAEFGVWGVAGPVVGGGSVGDWYRFLPGVNQANFGSGDERYQVNCQEAVVALHNSVGFGRQFVAGPAGVDRDPAGLEAAFGAKARWVGGVAGVEQYARSGPVGVGVPVIYQRADGSAHVIAAVHAGDRDGHEVVDLLDPQKGEVAEKADVLAATKVWVIPVPEAEPDRAMVVLPPSGSGLRSQGWGSGLPIEVTGLKRQPGASRPEAGKTGPKGTTRTRGEIDERAEAGESSWAVVDQSSRRARQEVPAAAAGIDPGSPGKSCSPRPISQRNRTSGVRSGNRKRRKLA